MYVRQSDNQYTQELTHCDGSTASVIATTQCTIPLATLTASPFSLALGDQINAKVIAYNAYGDSVESAVGGGAVIQLVPDAPINFVNVPSITRDTVIGLSWQDGLSNGGTSIIDYEIFFDQGIGVYASLESALTEREYTAVDLYSSVTYTFKVRARNSVGFGPFSSELSILAAQIPDITLAPTTRVLDRWSIVIEWTAPYNGGSPITSYTILIRTTDVEVYDVDSVDCDGTDATIISSTTCTVQVSTLREAPFSIPWGASIYAKIVTTNIYGDSAASEEGNGAIILTFPDEPINLANNLEVTWGSTIGLTWDEGDQNGGTPVVDYTVMSLASGSDTYIERQVGVESTSITLEGFNLGTTYTFKVRARSAFDFSVGYSNEVSILAAMNPNQP